MEAIKRRESVTYSWYSLSSHSLDREE